MTSFRLANEIHHVISDYSTAHCSLPFVCKKVIQYMKDSGSQAEIIDDKHRDYKILRVDNHRFKIVRYRNWLRYDVTIVD